jgi:hypothetical protein
MLHDHALDSVANHLDFVQLGEVLSKRARDNLWDFCFRATSDRWTVILPRYNWRVIPIKLSSLSLSISCCACLTAYHAMVSQASTSVCYHHGSTSPCGEAHFSLSPDFGLTTSDDIGCVCNVIGQLHCVPSSHGGRLTCCLMLVALHFRTAFFGCEVPLVG